MRQKLTPQENRRAWLMAGLIVLLMLLIAGAFLLPQLNPPRAAAPDAPAPDLLSVSEGMDAIRVSAVFDPEAALLTATQVMELRNPAGQPLEEIILRSYSGAYLTEETSPAAVDELFLASYGAAFSPGGLTLESAQVNGAPVAFTWQDDAHTVLRLSAAWPEDATLTVELRYTVRIPRCASRFGEDNGIWTLGNVFPSLALWQEGAWRTDPYIAIGDPFQSACANWQVEVDVPAGYAVAATGYAQPAEADGRARYAFDARAVRDFALVISDRWQMRTAMAGDTRLVAYALTDKTANDMLTYAAGAIACFERHYGPYVYPTLTLAEVSFPFGGMEYPRMVMIASDAVNLSGDVLETTVVHETAHQWWYAMVGSDSVNQPWQDESLCEYALMDYIGDTYGAQARANAAFSRIELALRITIPRSVTPGSPIDYFANLTEYSWVVYQRGAALWMALEEFMGKPQLDAALQEYQRTFRFGVATREDLTAILTRHAGKDVSGLMVDYLDTHMN